MSHLFEDLPLKNGEEDGSWQSAMAHYGHTGCPGLKYEDVCGAPWECAVKGACRIQFEKNGAISMAKPQSKYAAKRHSDRDRGADPVRYNDRNRNQETRPRRDPPELVEVHSDRIGRVIEVSNIFHTKFGDYFFVAHSWDNEEHTAFTIEGAFESKADAIRRLGDL